jgi:hypothetical protein
MFRVFDVSRCPPPNALTVPVARKRLPLSAGLDTLTTSPSHSRPVCSPFDNRNSSVSMPCDETPLPGINNFVGLTEQLFEY